MTALLDSSVLVAAFTPDDTHHAACSAGLARPDVTIYIHALNETFASLTGGKAGIRLRADDVAQLIRERVLGSIPIVTLDSGEIVEAQRQARGRGVRGGAIYDFLHLVAARKAGAEALYTLNTSDFLAFHRAGDPEIRCP